MAEAAVLVLERDARSTTGNFFIDEEVLSAAGITDFAAYSVVPGSRELLPDLFL
jgi:citronellol/citronellal dehydrogenase